MRRGCKSNNTSCGTIEKMGEYNYTSSVVHVLCCVFGDETTRNEQKGAHVYVIIMIV